MSIPALWNSINPNPAFGKKLLKCITLKKVKDGSFYLYDYIYIYNRYRLQVKEQNKINKKSFQNTFELNCVGN